MPLSMTRKKAKTPAELKAEVREGQVRLEKDTKVVALEPGYSDQMREGGDVFYVPKGTIYTPGITWFEPVDEKTATTEETKAYEDMTPQELKVMLAKLKVPFKPNAKKQDLIDALIAAKSEDSLA